MLFEPGMVQFDQDLAANSTGALETLVRVGMAIGHSPGQPPHSPAGRRKPEEFTHEEKADARRRIEGSISPVKVDGMPMLK